MLFAVGFMLGLVRTWLKVALEEGRSCRVFVVVMFIYLLLGWPTIFMVSARLRWALSSSRVGLFMLGQVTGPFEFFITTRLTAALGSKLFC